MRTLNRASAMALVMGAVVPARRRQQRPRRLRPRPAALSTLEAQRSDSQDGESLHVLVEEGAPGIVDATFDFGASITGFRVDCNQGVGDFMPNGDAIDAAQMKLVNGVLAQLESQLPKRDDASHACQDVAPSASSFDGEVPTGELLHALHLCVPARLDPHLLRLRLQVHRRRPLRNGRSGLRLRRRQRLSWSLRQRGCGGGGSVAYTQDCVSSRQGPHQLRHGGRRLHVRR